MHSILILGQVSHCEHSRYKSTPRSWNVVKAKIMLALQGSDLKDFGLDLKSKTDRRVGKKF